MKSKTYILLVTSAFLCLDVYAAGEEAAILKMQPPPSTYQLSKNLLTSERTLKTAIDNKNDPEVALAETYDSLQLLCKKQFSDIEADQERYATAEARTNVIGNIVTLLSVVSTYAAGKTVLAGLGMSSGSPGSVSSSVTQFFSTKSSSDKATIAVLRNQLSLALDRYEAVDPATDVKGTRRLVILSRAKGICMGLSPLVAAPAVDQKPGGTETTPPKANPVTVDTAKPAAPPAVPAPIPDPAASATK